MSNAKVDPVRLVRPGKASPEVEQIYDEICRLKDPRWLGPLFGFFANVPGLLKKYVYCRNPTTPIVRAMHGDSSGVRGAAMLWPA